MVRPNRAAAIEKYREALLTNPETFRAKLEKVREDLRDRSELMFIERDLSEADPIPDPVDENDQVAIAHEERRARERQQIDNMIISIGQRVEAIDEVLAADKKSQKELFTLGKKGKAHREKQLKAQRGKDVKTLTDPVVPVEEEGEGTSENE